MFQYDLDTGLRLERLLSSGGNPMHEHDTMSPWRRFWERGGWWKALVLVLVYYGLYQLAALLVSFIFAGVRLVPGSAVYVVVGTGLPILIGGVLLLVFAWSIGWLRELFGRQAIRGRGWMWIAITVVLFTNVLRFLTLDYAKADVAMNRPRFCAASMRVPSPVGMAC
ncbi:hypothetical protein LLS1_38300 [Leifsonia sp. LS1]|uniref:hypothetical protein n=1 Tax=Leifsonia sp. LS1 TaxID=2828483 RepID=UPI001CFF21F3|nr:hypothetical protein [Leifsonia sp. LS1]GIT82161.1 hypothetical protein LLS1_38300 [Leifsonia sp. LS1]